MELGPNYFSSSGYAEQLVESVLLKECTEVHLNDELYHHSLCGTPVVTPPLLYTFEYLERYRTSLDLTSFAGCGSMGVSCRWGTTLASVVTWQLLNEANVGIICPVAVLLVRVALVRRRTCTL